MHARPYRSQCCGKWRQSCRFTFWRWYTVISPRNCHAGGIYSTVWKSGYPISEAFKSFKADFEISVDEEQREEEFLNLVHEDEPPAKKKREEESIESVDVDASVGQFLGRGEK